jgi:(S)-3,5-dihydroxyphenylglycine transaminase
MSALSRERLHVSVTDPVSTSMNFLNEVAARFPDAISLAAGRPYDGFLDPARLGHYLEMFSGHLRAKGLSERRIAVTLMQYGRTNGVIGDLVARLLSVDEGIDVAPEAIVITAGCQEGMVIVLRGLCAGPDDVLLAASPCYVGEGPDGLDPAEVARVAAEVRAQGRNPRALYLVPDFANPSGDCMSVAKRHELLKVAAEADLLILEDDPYGLFGLDDRPRPKLKALDTDARVVYLGSFSKSAFPGARIGFVVADQEVVDASGARSVLADELSTIKSMLTVNTSPISQAVIGGVLVEAECSLRAANREKIAFYRRNLSALLSALERHFPPESGVRWNTPAGGFFAVINDLSVVADVKLLEHSAREHGVLWTPMSFFYDDDAGDRSIRLSCSALELDEIEEGVRRLAAMLAEAV